MAMATIGRFNMEEVDINEAQLEILEDILKELGPDLFEEDVP